MCSKPATMSRQLFVILLQFLMTTDVLGVTFTRSNIGLIATISAHVDEIFNQKYHEIPTEIAFCRNHAPTTIRLCSQIRYIDLHCKILGTMGNYLQRSYLGSISDSSRHQPMYLRLDKNGSFGNYTEKVRLTRESLNQSDCYYCWCESETFWGFHRSPGFKIAFDFDCFAPPFEFIQEEPSYGGPAVVSCWNDTIVDRHTVEWSFKPTDSYDFRTLNAKGVTVAITNLTEAHVGTYKCAIWFEESFYRYEAIIHLSADGPSAPNESKFLALSESSFKISWKTPTAVKEPGFTLALYERNGADWIWLEDRHLSNRSAPMAEFAQLRSLTVYKIEIRTDTSSGTSKALVRYFSTREQGYETKYDAVIARPEDEPSSLSCSIYDNVTKVNWYTRDESTGDWNALGSTSFPVTASTVGRFKCEVPGEPMMALVYKLALLKRPIKPEGFECKQIGGKIEAKWSSEDEHNSYISHRVERYKLMHRKIGSKNGWSILELGADQYSSVIERRDGSLSAIRLIASNRAGDSAASTISCAM